MCVVITADALMCRSTNLVKVLPSSGFLSNLVPGSRAGLPSADCGGDSSPHWLIEAQPGQHINVTLWDFSRRSPVTSDSHFASLPGCIKYATLTEVGPEMPSGAAARTKSVCGSGGVESGRVRHVYMSAGSAIQVQIHAISPADGLSAATTPHFLLEYHSKKLHAHCSIMGLCNTFFGRPKGFTSYSEEDTVVYADALCDNRVKP